jgi:hypothetical protein
MELETIGDDLLLIMQGAEIAKRENGKWLLLEPGWSQWLSDEVEAALRMEGVCHDLH